MTASLIERAAAAANIPIERDVPAVGNRRCKDWAKIIGLVRKLESQDQAHLEDTRREMDAVVKTNLALQAKVNLQQEQLAAFRVKGEMVKRELAIEDQEGILKAIAG